MPDRAPACADGKEGLPVLETEDLSDCACAKSLRSHLGTAAADASVNTEHCAKDFTAGLRLITGTKPHRIGGDHGCRLVLLHVVVVL
jgi:hypothetical protein